MKIKQWILMAGICIALPNAQAHAQSGYKHMDKVFEQASETSGLVVQYARDIQAVNHFYGAMAQPSRSQQTVYAPDQLQRLIALDEQYLRTLNAQPFDEFSIHGKTDYILLKNKIERSLSALKRQTQQFARLKAYIPFADAIYDFESKRRRGQGVDGEQIANQLHQAYLQVQQATKQLSSLEKLPEEDANYLEALIVDLDRRLKFAYDFYQGYDPLFTWWVPEPYKALSQELSAFAKLTKSKSDAKVFDDGSNIGGRPIGREELSRLLLEEMIPYSPEELLKIADREFAWCEAELLKASRQMGFGDDWRAAQEKVKNTYVQPGKQPETIIKLNQDALDFIKARDLLTMPKLAHETWGMTMMSPEQQRVSPFFLGGRDILIAYPTNTMTHEQKLMSMRGNNPNFARGIVQHELVPGHHLQYFMNSRYKSYRGEHFRTPFWTEGWTLYWELLLYSMDFPQTPEERIGMLFWRMHRCARITFSINYHLGKWTPQQCIDYLVQEVGHEPSTAHGEVKRSFEGNYGPLYQLAYMIGGLQVWSLKEEVVDKGGMPIKEFHDRFMKENYMPIEMLRANLLNLPLTRDYKSKWRFDD